MLFETLRRKASMVAREDALPGRDTPLRVDPTHAVPGTTIVPPFPEGTEDLIVGLGCFWGAERLFWKLPGVYTTAVGYAGGYTPNPTYEEVYRAGLATPRSCAWCSTRPRSPATTYPRLLGGPRPDPGQPAGQRRRHAVPVRGLHDESRAGRRSARVRRALPGRTFTDRGNGQITTEIAEAGEFYYAETYHQQYLAKNPGGYCGLGGTGVSCPIGTGATAA